MKPTSIKPTGPLTEIKENSNVHQKTNKQDDNFRENSLISHDYRVSVSDQGQALKEFKAKALQQAKSVDPVRQEKVERLRELLERGEYQVDSGKVADGMLLEAIKDELANTKSKQDV